MPAIPDTFRAYVAERREDHEVRGVREFREADLPEGEVDIRIEWSSVNDKDGLATRFDGKVTRRIGESSPSLPSRIDRPSGSTVSDSPLSSPGVWNELIAFQFLTS